MSDKVATGTAYASSFVTFFAASWSFNELLALGGFLIGLATFIFNVVYKERVLRDERAYKQAMLKELHNKEVVSIAQDVNTVVKE